VLLIHGRRDALVPAANSRRLLAVLPPGSAELIEYSACGHVPHEELPERFVADVAAFLDRAAPRPPR
jgi:pimeloyl-ACP methyl ester carboxylesterase